MSCTNCKAKGGCDTRKTGEREHLSEVLERIYPTRRWGEPDDAARYKGGPSASELRHLQAQASGILQAPVFLDTGCDEESRDSLWVLCVGREPSLFEQRQRGWVDESVEIGTRDVMLRLSLSQMARVAVLEEVVLELRGEGNELAIVEQPRPGVYDPILMKRVQKLVDLVVAHDIAYYDYAIADAPPEGYDGGSFQARWGVAPGSIHYLFHPHPPGTTRLLPLPRRHAA